MDWARQGKDWPHAEHSRFVEVTPHRWHIQEMGKGPLLLLIHGAGGATQSWRHLMPLLARDHRVVAMDLPGQGFTRPGSQRRFGLGPMAEDLGALMADQGWQPTALIGHSAGAAIALELARGMDPAPPVVGINAALGNFEGLAGLLFPLMAKALSMAPFVARVFTASAGNPQSVARLIAGTGSTLSQEEMRHYRSLVGDPAHVDGTLAMMAQWDLRDLLDALPSHPAPTLLLAAEGDRAVPAATSRRVAARMPRADYVLLPGLGHLAHEEAPEAVAEPILSFLARHPAS